jgi:hypothetical protein
MDTTIRQNCPGVTNVCASASKAGTVLLFVYVEFDLSLSV